VSLDVLLLNASIPSAFRRMMRFDEIVHSGMTNGLVWIAIDVMVSWRTLDIKDNAADSMKIVTRGNHWQ